MLNLHACMHLRLSSIKALLLPVMPVGSSSRLLFAFPALQVRTQFRKIFVAMGFEEMPTNNYVESR